MSRGATGFIAVRGTTADFGVTEVLETKSINDPALQVTFDGLSAGQTCYFRILSRDDFYDSWPDISDLNATDVLTVVTAP